MYDIRFIFVWCLLSSPAKYERDLNYLTYTLGKSNFPVTGKLTNGALVTPTLQVNMVDNYNITTTKQSTTKNRVQTLKSASYHDVNFVIIDSTLSCHYDNLLYNHWRLSWHRDNSRFQW